MTAVCTRRWHGSACHAGSPVVLILCCRSHGIEESGFDISDPGRILAPAARQNDKEARFSAEAIAALGPADCSASCCPRRRRDRRSMSVRVVPPPSSGGGSRSADHSRYRQAQRIGQGRGATQICRLRAARTIVEHTNYRAVSSAPGYCNYGPISAASPTPH